MKPYQVRASRAELVAATETTPDKVRGAVAWLIRAGFLIRLDTGPKTRAAFTLVRGGGGTDPQDGNGRKCKRANDFRDGQPGPTPKMAPKPPRRPQDGPKSKAKRDNGLDGLSTAPNPQDEPKILSRSRNRRPTPPKAPPAPPEGGVVSRWYAAHGGRPPDEPKATKNPDAFRRAVLSRAVGDQTPQDQRRIFKSWAEGTFDFRNRRGRGVVEFARLAPQWIEGRDEDRRANRRAGATATDSPGGRQSPGALAARAGNGASASRAGEGIGEPTGRPPNPGADPPQGERPAVARRTLKGPEN